MLNENFVQLSDQMAKMKLPPWVGRLFRFGLFRRLLRMLKFVERPIGRRILGVTTRENEILMMQPHALIRLQRFPQGDAIEWAVAPYDKPPEKWQRFEAGWKAMDVVREAQAMFLTLPEGEFGNHALHLRRAKSA